MYKIDDIVGGKAWFPHSVMMHYPCHKMGPEKDPLHGLFSYRPLTDAALCSVIAQQVYYSTMLAQ